MSLRAARICRICEQTSHLQNMLLISNERYAKQFVECANVEFDIDDELPKFLCDPCILNLNKAYQFKQQCEYAQKKFYSQLFGVSTIKLPKVTATPPINSKSQLTANLTPNKKDCSLNSTKATTNIISKPENIPISNETSVNDSTLSASATQIPLEKSIIKNDNCPSLSNGVQLIILKKLKLKPKPKTHGQQSTVIKLPPTDINEIENLPNKNQCSICLRILLNENALKKHLNWHNNPKSGPSECKICSKRYSNNTILRRHIETVHEKLKPYVCDICGKSFGQKNELSHHIDKVHIGAQYSCDYCTEKFVSQSDFRNHKSTKHREYVRIRKSNNIKKKYYNKDRSRKYVQFLREKDDEKL